MQPADQPHSGFRLMAAIANADLLTVRSLLESQPDATRAELANFADYDRRTPLHLACCCGYVAIAKELLKNGADSSNVDRFGSSCVREAMRYGRVQILRVLGEFNASFPDSIQATHVDPKYVLGRDLIVVVGEGNLNAVCQLVRCFSANVNFANADGRTPLHIAVARRDYDIARYLLEAGADVHKCDRWDASPLDDARRAGADDLAELLAKHDAAAVALAHGVPPQLLKEPSFAVC